MSKRGPYTFLATREVYRNPWIRVREDKVLRPGGKEGIFGVVEMVAGSSVLPVDNEGNVYLVSEYKYGIERESLEVMSGALASGETPLEAAQRELKEELGLTASQWDDLGCVDPFTTIVKSPNHLFLAQGLAQGSSSPDEGEELRTVKISLDEALARVMAGEITHAGSCVLILKAVRLLGK